MLPVNDRVEFLQKQHLERKQRLIYRQREQAIVLIQKSIRGFLVRRWFHRKIRANFDSIFHSFVELDQSLSLPVATSAFFASRALIFRCLDWNKDRERVAHLCRYLVLSCDSSDVRTSTISLALSKETLVNWDRFLRRVLRECCQQLAHFHADRTTDLKLTGLFLHTLVSFSTCASWVLIKDKRADAVRPVLNQFCGKLLAHLVANGLYRRLSSVLTQSLSRNKPTLRPESLKAIIFIALKPMLNEQFSNELVYEFIESILTSPALFLHLPTESRDLLLSHKLFERSINLLAIDLYRCRVLSHLDGVTSLNLLANLIHMSSFDQSSLVDNLLEVAKVFCFLLDKCRVFVITGKNTNHWHPIFGWFSQRLDEGVQCAMPAICIQLQHLWSRHTVRCLFQDLVVIASCSFSAPVISRPETTPKLSAAVRNLLRKIGSNKEVSLSGNGSTTNRARSGTVETTLTALVCSLYQRALTTFVQLHIDILSGLCREDYLLPKLWAFISFDGVETGLRTYLDLLNSAKAADSPEFSILTLFCDATSCVISILDEIELYDLQKPFNLVQLATIAWFCNLFCFRVIWDGLLAPKTALDSHLYSSVLNLTLVLHNRDCHRRFTSTAQFWLIKDICRSSGLIAESEKADERAVFLMHKMPHLVAHKDRVALFRRYVHLDKELQDENRLTLIAVQRGRIVEDGYRQLARLSDRSLKSTIRVKFINVQGLDEAGIDQDGVFKEFLESTIQAVFAPGLNLFKSTADNLFYPSPTSSVQDNHLALFDFIGRMLGKAVYEGIVLDISLTSFFLASLLGRRFNPFDELSSLDPQLYRNLTYVKHYEGDVDELRLTFSVDEEVLGRRNTYDLVPGGRSISVTNENKIGYIHKLAQFYVVDRCREQTKAFVTGFQALIAAPWLALFSPRELQLLISGDGDDLDLLDLRKHTQYYGGFHNGHRLVSWLWDVLDKDFTANERRLFLKFATSCSRPPLLGFSHLEPPFSIRCVEVSDDQDEGDTLGSVIRGFLTIGRRNAHSASRLPTASTCFNLLKLPNYQKKSILREKLRYAIHSGTGFELS